MARSAAEAALIVAENLRTRIAELEVAGLQGGMTASIGVAVYPAHGIGADELIEAADLALSRAKKAGRNRVESAAQPLRAARQVTAETTGANPVLVGGASAA